MEMRLQYTIKQISTLAGVPRRTVARTIDRKKIKKTVIEGNGGDQYVCHLPDLPPDWQLAIFNKNGAPANLLPALAPSVQRMALEKITGGSDFAAAFPSFAETALATRTSAETVAYYDKVGPEFDALMKPEVQRMLRIVEEALAVPRGWGAHKWVVAVAEKYEIVPQSVYRYIKRHKEKGICGLVHTKKNKGQPKVWTEEALTHWLGICLKREHRKIQKKSLYDQLLIEADRRGWRIGSLASACQHYRDYKGIGLLESYQRGGMRSLDNALPPILRDYSDLAPLECLVGDQHRKNRWVIDDFTGDSIRIEAYVWQDLRTRLIYGGACCRHYNAYLMGLALRMGMLGYGTFGSVYTDNGKPEISIYFNGILANMRSYGLDARQTIDVSVDLLDMDPEEIYPATEDPRMHRLAIVQNAKAKMIEGTWRVIEDIMTGVMLLPGDTKRLCDDIHNQDIDQQELKRLAAAGKLPLMSQYIIAFYKALDYYNKVKPHRGVAKEWRWPNRPKTVTPFDCLMACYNDGWRPRQLSDQAINLLFMMEEERTINRGHIAAFNDIYTHDDLLNLHGERVKIRYDLVDEEHLIVLHEGRYICTATPIEYSSMKDMDLARRKIHEKRLKAKAIAEIYMTLTLWSQDRWSYGAPEQS